MVQTTPTPLSDVTDLHGQIVELKRQLDEKEEVLRREIRQYQAENGRLREQVRLLLAGKYGKKSEKLAGPAMPELPFFDEAGPETDAPATDQGEKEQGEEKIAVPAHERCKPRRTPLPESLPRETVVHDVPEEQKVCAHGQARPVIREEVSEQLDVVPAQVKVVRHVRLVYGGCPRCGESPEDGKGVVSAPLPEQVVPKGLPTAGTLAHVVVAKFVDATPLYRQEEQFQRMGVAIGRGTMSGWVMEAAAACRCMEDQLVNELKEGPCIQVDETTVQVLKEPGRQARQQSYMWVFRGGPPGRTVLIYRYKPTRAGSVAADMLSGYQGYVQTDGYAGYDFLDHRPGVSHLGCLAHVRRHFMDVRKVAGAARGTAKSDADHILEWIGRIYHLEEKACAPLAPDWAAIVAVRQEQIKPVLDKIHARLGDLSGRTPPQGLLGKAVRYGLAQWTRVLRYLEHGRLRPDNNLAENAIRPFVIGRNYADYGIMLSTSGNRPLDEPIRARRSA